MATESEIRERVQRSVEEIERLQRENAELRDNHALTCGHIQNYADKIKLLEAKLAAAEAALKIADIQRGRLPCVGNATPESRVRGSGAAFGCGFEHGFRGQGRNNPYDRNPQMRVWEQGFEYGESSLRAAINAAKPEVKAADENLYPCITPGCKTMRTKAEGGTTFTVCDECWDAKEGAKVE
jgi:hypothetical protein